MTGQESCATFLARPKHEQIIITLGEFALSNILRHPSPPAAVARVNAFLRYMLHDKPRGGKYVRRGRRKLAANL